MANLAMLLLRRHEKREIAKALALPLSTLYRWVERYGRDQIHHGKSFPAEDTQELQGLLAECEANGFDFRKSVSCLFSGNLTHPAIDVDSQCDESKNVLQHLQKSTPATVSPPCRMHRCATLANLSTGVCKRIEAARQTIDTRYYSKLSCDALAAAAILSKWHFIKLFKATYGIAPYQYLTRIRVQHAKHLLDTTAYSLETIAMAVGFDAGSSLSRAFRAVEGVNLSAFFKGRKIRYLSGPAAVTSA